MSSSWNYLGRLASSATLADLLLRLALTVGILSGGVVATLSAMASRWYSDHGIFFLVAVFIVSLVVLSAVALMISAAIKNLKKSKFYDSVSNPPEVYNPKLSLFQDKVFYLRDMFTPISPVVENKTFVNCDIIGPGVVLFEERNEFPQCNFIETGDVIAVPHGAYITGGLAFMRCTFRDCRFFRTQIVTAAPQVMAELRRIGANVVGSDDQTEG